VSQLNKESTMINYQKINCYEQNARIHQMYLRRLAMDSSTWKRNIPNEQDQMNTLEQTSDN